MTTDIAKCSMCNVVASPNQPRTNLQILNMGIIVGTVMNVPAFSSSVA